MLYLSTYDYETCASALVRGVFDESSGAFTETGRINMPAPDCLCPCGDYIYVSHAINEIDATPENIQDVIDAQQFSVAVLRKSDFTIAREIALPIHNTCHISVSGDWLFAVDYYAGEVSAQNGSKVQVLRHAGHGINPARQEGPHTHCATLTPDGKHVLVCDLGLDSVYLYPFDAKNGLGEPEILKCPAGSGPRHAAFANGRIYVACEMGSIIAQFSIDAGHEYLGAVSTLPKGYAGESAAAAIHISNDGKLLGVSNRGHDSVAVCEIRKNGELGDIRFIETVKCPRDFAFSPDGRWIIGGSQTEQRVTATPTSGGGAHAILDLRSAALIFA